MASFTERETRKGVADIVAPGVRRVLAGNPGAMTQSGTNTYLIEQADGLAVIDPGPDLAEHVDALLRIAGGMVRRILVTHSHADHVGAAAALARATAAPVLAWHRPAAAGFRPDRGLVDDQVIGDGAGRLVAVHTPGHASDHLCFRAPELRPQGSGPEGGLLFSGDHVMGWSTSVVSPPDGDMAAYMASLRLLLSAPDALYLPGHGPALPTPHSLLRGMLAHRN